MFSIIFPKNTWSLKSNFPKKSSPSGRNLARRFFRLHSSSLAQGCRIAPTLSVLSVTPRSHLLWVTHSVPLLSKSRACPRRLDGSDRLCSQDPPGPGHTKGLGKSLLSFSLPWHGGEGRGWSCAGNRELPQVPRTGAWEWLHLPEHCPRTGTPISFKQQSPRPWMAAPLAAAPTSPGSCHL